MSAQQPTADDGPRLRIGELSRRTGASPDTLRAWERRYGLLRPERSEGGFRLYGPRDERRVRAMQGLIASGISTAEAARLAQRDGEGSGQERFRAGAAPDVDLLLGALTAFDEPMANEIIDRALAALTVEAVSERLILPAMRELGARWAAGQLTIAQEHFATGVVRARLLALGRNWGAGSGPLAVLACPPGERHDIGLLAYGLALKERGWRIAFLGVDTPIETITRTARELRPAAVVLAAMTAEPIEASAGEISDLAAGQNVLVGGADAATSLAEGLGAEALPANPGRAADATDLQRR